MMIATKRLFALALFGATTALVAAKRPHKINRHTEIGANSKLGKHLLKHARPVAAAEGEGTADATEADRSLNEDVDYSFVADYSIKFQGCHHVQQWNEYAEDEDDVRVKTKRLVRFRLCESDSCSNSNSAGCTSKFGDYVVDMNTFVSAYLEALEDEQDYICQEAAYDCQVECNGNDDAANCMSACYEAYDVSFCENYYNDDDGNQEDFDAADYAECAEFDGRRRRLQDNSRRLDNGYNYYIGPYCADQGGEIHLGVFTDETCTTYAQNGETTFYNMMGFNLPYSDESLVSSRCFACGQNDGNGNELKDFCANIYDYSGKCETRMNIGYPNESSCSYIEGIKIIREDGVIRTSTVKKSKAAAVCIGLFLTLAVLLAGYVYYLRTKLGRAQINLAAATQSLT